MGLDRLSYTVYQTSGLGDGLNLRDKSDTVSDAEAIDALNVVFTRAGAVSQRDGFGVLTSAALNNQPDSMIDYTNSGTRYLVVGNGSRLDSLSTTGVSQGNAAPTASPHYFARYGAPGTEQLYIANGTDQVRLLDGTTYSIPDFELDDDSTDVALVANYLAVDATSNRLVAADLTGSNFTNANDSSTVRWSEVGEPRLWAQTNFNRLSPGDGENIMGVVSWRELIIVFKETKFFVFYGTSIDSTGAPVFDYRVVDGGIGLASSRAVSVAKDGVYFLDRKGVYRTRGAEAEYMSTEVEPIFRGGTSAFFQGGELLHSQITNCVMHVHEERVHLAYTSTSTTNNYMLVYDTRYGWWSLFDIPASSMASFRPADNFELVFGYSAGANDVGRYSSLYTADASANIASRWQSGWNNYGQPSQKTVRETQVTGEGKIDVGTAVDYAISSEREELDFSVTQPVWDGVAWDNVNWGPIASHQFEFNRNAVRGTVFSLMLEGVAPSAQPLWGTDLWGTAEWSGPQPWTAHNVEQHIREVRAPSIETPE